MTHIPSVVIVGTSDQIADEVASLQAWGGKWADTIDVIDIDEAKKRDYDLLELATDGGFYSAIEMRDSGKVLVDIPKDYLKLKNMNRRQRREYERQQKKRKS